MTTTAQLAVRKTVTVPLPPERAFELFTARMGEWWPFATHSVYGDAVETGVFEERVGGRVLERTADGREHEWARVRAYEPPSRFVLEWVVNPARPATELEVTFSAEGDATRVELEHRGWGDDDDGRRSYDEGWETVLARFAEAAA